MNKTFFARSILLTSILAVLAGGALYAIGLTFFINNIGVYTGGVTGLSQIFVRFMGKLGVDIPLGLVTIMLNIPILIFGWFKVERRFTLLSIFSVLYIGVLISIFSNYTTVELSPDLSINVIFGGLLVGLGTGITLRYGASTGGTDIILAYLSSKTGKSFGGYSIAINMVIVTLAFLLEPSNTNIPLITIVLFFFVSLVVNQVHTKHKRFTVLIVTKNEHVVAEQIHIRCGRGATILDGRGSYSKQETKVVMTVISSYQIYTLKDIVAKYDPSAFVNILPTREIFGNFAHRANELPIK